MNYLFWIVIIAAIVIVICGNSKKSTEQNNKKSKGKYNGSNNPKEEKPTKVDYENTDYFKETHTSYEDMIMDKGKAGEYSTYRSIMNVKGYKRFLFNTYVPNKDNEEKKTEIDIIMIHETGIYVIECKNYNGNIYGDETSEKWCQMFGSKKKYFFYNPIKQNYRHIQYLRELIGKDKKLISIIAFGNGATLKKITNSNKDIIIINNKYIRKTLEEKISGSESTITTNEIDEIYNRFKEMQW